MLIYFICSFVNVFIHVIKTLLIVNSGKFVSSLSNSFCYTFSAVVVKFIAESDLTTAIIVSATTNFLGCYCGKYVYEYLSKQPAFEAQRGKSTNI